MFDKLLHKYLAIPYVLHVRRYRKTTKNKPMVVLLHGIGNTGATWDHIISELPDDTGIMVVDLLGFGKSPRPDWLVYDATVQAQALYATLLRQMHTRPIIIVGHSMGALVAVEFARRYPSIAKRLILCSPPFYDATKKSLLYADERHRRLYQAVQKRKTMVLSLVPYISRSRFTNESFDVTEANIDIYMSALNASIVNQRSLDDVQGLNVPQVILHGRLDPVVVGRNLKIATKANPNIQVRTILAGHEMVGKYIPAVIEEIAKATKAE